MGLVPFFPTGDPIHWVIGSFLRGPGVVALGAEPPFPIMVNTLLRLAFLPYAVNSFGGIYDTGRYRYDTRRIILSCRVQW